MSMKSISNQNKMFAELSLSLSKSVIYDFSKKIIKKISKKEYVQFVLRKLSLDKQYSDFPERYVASLVELRFLDKPKPVIEFFREESIMRAYYDYYYAEGKTGVKNNKEEFIARLNHFMLSLKVGDEINEHNIDISSEIAEFCLILQDKINESRTVSEAELFLIIKDHSEQIQEIHHIITELKRFNIQNVLDENGESIYNLKNIDNTKLQEIIHQALSSIPKQLSQQMPATALSEIIGRETDLLELHELLFDKRQSVVINGIGGVGKTTLAQGYTHKYFDEYKHIAWIALDSQNPVLGFLQDTSLIKNLNIDITDSTYFEQFKAVMHGLNSLDGNPKLLVLDNVNHSIKDIQSILPTQPNWHLLLISREELFGFIPKKLELLSPDNAYKLFKKHCTRIDLLDNQINELLKTIDYHTLTIEILAKTAQKQLCSINDLQNAIESDLRSMIQTRHNQINNVEIIDRVTSYLSSIFDFSLLSLEEKWLLKQFCFLPSGHFHYLIIQELIKIEEGSGVSALSETLNNLVEKGWLLRIDETISFKLHLIIKEVAIRKLEFNPVEVKAHIDNAIKLLSIDKAKDNPIDKFQWIQFGDAIIDTINKLKVHNGQFTKIDISSLQDRLGTVYEYTGNYKQSKQFFESALQTAKEIYGEESAEVAIIQNNLALVNKDLGEYNEAMQLLERALYTGLKKFDKNHPQVAQFQSNLALVCHAQNNNSRACELLEKALESDLKHFGENHPTIAVRLNNLASVYSSLGNPSKALELSKNALNIEVNNFGEKHPSTVYSLNTLANLYFELGELKLALEYFEKVLKINEEIYPSEHPIIAKAQNNLGSTYFALGDLKNALVLLQKALITEIKLLGPDHPDVAERQNNLAWIFFKLNQRGKAIELWRLAYSTSIRTLGKDHPTTLELGDYISKFRTDNK